MEDHIEFINNNYKLLTKHVLNIDFKDTNILHYTHYGMSIRDIHDRFLDIKIDGINSRSVVAYPFINGNNLMGNANNFFSTYLQSIIGYIRKLSNIILIIINDNNIEYYLNNKYVLLYETLTVHERCELDYCIRELFLLDEREKSKEALNEMNFTLNNEFDDNKINLIDGILKEEYKLYNYQKTDIKWMNNLTNKIKNKENYIYYTNPVYYKYGDLVYNKIYSKVHTLENLTVDPDKECFKLKYEYKGGNLISEMGLGKSIITLYYIFNNNIITREKYNDFVEFTINNKCKYLYKIGKKAGSFCNKKRINDMYCGEHKGTLFLDKPVTNYKNKEMFYIDDFIEDNYIKSNASLILCPNHLCDQWVNEYYNKFKNDKRITMLITQNQYNNITFGDLLLSDIIVISYEFFHKIKRESLCNIIQNMRLDDDLFKSNEYNYLNIFTWNGIFLDECHEINKLPKKYNIYNLVNSLNSETKWNITGTPFANGIEGYITLLQLNTVKEDNVEYTSEYIKSSNVLFRKNIKSNINEIKKNVITENLKIIEFTQQERNIYESYNNKNNINFLIKLCCDIELNRDIHHLIKNSKTMDEIQMIMLVDSENKKNKLTKEIELLRIEKENIEYILNEMSREENTYREEELNLDLRDNLTNTKRNITLKTNDLNSINRTYTYLNNIINNLKDKNNEQECPICLDVIENLTITKCGHKFCWECLYETHNIKAARVIKCPTCNTELTKNDIFFMDEKAEELSTDKELKNMIDSCKSSKLGNIIYFIKHSLDINDKVIIFSQWDIILDKIERVLQHFNLKHVYCTGTVYNKKRMIKQFTKGDSNIILLSSKNSASGINLTEANKIILVEPVYGSNEYRFNIESQAIGRADRIGQAKPIDIYRFIVKDTIEEKIYNGCEDYNINTN